MGVLHSVAVAESSVRAGRSDYLADHAGRGSLFGYTFGSLPRLYAKSEYRGKADAEVTGGRPLPRALPCKDLAPCSLGAALA